jgi:hypothetical protein
MYSIAPRTFALCSVSCCNRLSGSAIEISRDFESGMLIIRSLCTDFGGVEESQAFRCAVGRLAQRYEGTQGTVEIFKETCLSR